MAKKQFKAESKKLLDLMINSIYTNKEIFLRELISNANDAIDKLYYESLTNKSLKVNKKDLKIKISIDKEKRILSISDNGIGMTKDELSENLGTIAKSGSLVFKEMAEKNKDIDNDVILSIMFNLLISKLLSVKGDEEQSLSYKQQADLLIEKNNLKSTPLLVRHSEEV